MCSLGAVSGLWLLEDNSPLTHGVQKKPRAGQRADLHFSFGQFP